MLQIMINKIHWCVAVCAVNAQTVLHGRPSIVDRTPSVSDPIPRESRFLPTPPAFDALDSGAPTKYCHNVWCWKTRTVWLPDGEKILKLCLLVSTEYTKLTDGQTDAQTDTAWQHIPRLISLCIASRGKKTKKQGKSWRLTMMTIGTHNILTLRRPLPVREVGVDWSSTEPSHLPHPGFSFRSTLDIDSSSISAVCFSTLPPFRSGEVLTASPVRSSDSSGMSNGSSPSSSSSSSSSSTVSTAAAETGSTLLESSVVWRAWLRPVKPPHWKHSTNKLCLLKQQLFC